MMSYSNDPVLVFPSKVDPWISLALFAPLGFGLFMLSVGVGHRGPPAAPPWVMLLILALVLFAVGMAVWTFLRTRYEVGRVALVAYSGPFRQDVEIARIEAVQPTRNLRSAPALSLDRLEIQGRGMRKLLVSPRDRDGFLAALAARAPGLVRQGDSLGRVR
jgi:hypothetical protein